MGRFLKGNIYSQDGTGDPNWSKIYPVACNVMLVIKTEGEKSEVQWWPLLGDLMGLLVGGHV